MAPWHSGTRHRPAISPLTGFSSSNNTAAAASVAIAEAPKSVRSGIVEKKRARPAGEHVAGGVRQEPDAHRQADKL